MRFSCSALFLCFSCSTTLLGCVSTQTLSGDGQSKSDSRALPSFTRVRAEMPIAITSTGNETEATVVTSDANLLHTVQTRVESGTLVISSACESCKADYRTAVSVTLPGKKVVEWKLSEGSTLDADGVDVDDLRVELVGNANARFKNVTVDDELAVKATDESSIMITGKSSSIKIQADEAAKLDLSGLSAGKGTFELEDKSQTRADVADKANIDLDDNAELELAKQPASIQVHSESAGRLRFVR